MPIFLCIHVRLVPMPIDYLLGDKPWSPGPGTGSSTVKARTGMGKWNHVEAYGAWLKTNGVLGAILLVADN